ncbi:CpaE family protein [Virgibacillus xinjiangensis]|uniref:CpaE family protein n=1 Tax=Virgibacillus xinjiangensis TaxID=393090 RepID=A0ABV7CZ15_9BACI
MGEEQGQGKKIVVVSASGGVGKTAVMVNLAAQLAQRNNSVTVVDADLSFGDTALALDLQPDDTIKEAAERKDIDNIQAYLMKHTSSVKLLPAPLRPEHAELISPDFLEAALNKISHGSDITLVDTQTGLTELNLRLLEAADQILVIGTPQMAVLKNTKLLLETLDLLGMKEKALLVINKFISPTAIRAEEISDLLGVETPVYLPRDDKQMDHSLDQGQPLVLNSPKLAFSAEASKLAEIIGFDTGQQQIKDKGRGILGRISLKGMKRRRMKNESIS